MYRRQVQREWSQQLTQGRVDWLIGSGFQWVRVVPRQWDATLRTPTVGRRLEFSVGWQTGAELVSTSQARRWMWNLCGL
jgi:hypothetical protein